MAFDIIGSIADLAGKVIDRVIPDPKAKAEALQKLAEMQQNGDLAVMAQQADINKIEAASADPFTSRWRPFIGWVCGSALAFQLVVAPIVSQISMLVGHPVQMIVLDTSLLSTLLVGMLGLGGMRTVEKLQGKA
jgi:hypothetical protein